MNKYKLGTLIFVLSITGLSSTCLAEEKEKSNEYIESTAINSLIADTISLSKLNNLYPEIKPANLTSDITLSEKEQVIAEKVKTFIDDTSFEQVIDVFSDSLYEDVPKNDKYQGQKYETTDLKDTYEAKLKKESETYAKLIVSVNEFEEYDQEKVKQQLVLVSYFIRWGSFSNGKHMFWNELYHPQSNFMTKEQTKQLNDAFIQLFSENPKQNLVSKNVNNTFKTASKAIGKNDSYKQFVERFLVQNGITEYSNWFYDSFKGRTYKDHYEGTNYDVGIWNRSDTFNNFLPYLLNQTDTTNLMIGETRGEIIFLSNYNYQNDFYAAEKVLRKAMKTITNILELYDRTIEDKELMNVDKVLRQRTVLDQGRNWLNPEDSLSYELYRVAGYDGSHPSNGAVAGAGQIQMQQHNLGSEQAIAHELAHELDNLFGAGGEYFTSYNYDPGRQKAVYLNTYADGELVKSTSDAISNTSTLQMQSKGDLVTYAKNMEDMAYVLDGIIAMKVLELPIEEQVNYIKIANIDGESGSIFYEDQNPVKNLTVEELKGLNIKTIDDLIDNNALITQPDDQNTDFLKMYGQGYGTTLKHSAFFLVNGKLTTYNHRIINTLLAEDGWEGFKKFNTTYVNSYYEDEEVNSNLELNELAAKLSLSTLRKVYDDENITYRSLVKQRYAESMKQFKEKGLLGENNETVLNELSSIDLLTFYSYKEKMMARYMRLTNDFSNSVFEDDDTMYYNVGSYTELYEIIEENPYAEINLKQDFEVNGKYAGKQLPAFSGLLNGNGFTISKGTNSLFKAISGAEIKNLILEDVNIMENTDDNIGGLTGISEKSKIHNVHVINSKIQSAKKSVILAGGLVGKSTSTNIIDSTVQNTSVIGSYVGGITGVADNSKFLNIYSTGELIDNGENNLRIGGIIGNGFGNTNVKNSYSTMKVTNGNGMLGSDYTGGNKRIKFENSISLPKIETANKAKFYDYGVSLAPWKNNFEVEEYTGKSSTTFENLDVSSIGLEQINQDFFANQLSWKNESIWGIENTTSEKELPYLKNSDPRNKEEKDLSKLTLKTERKEIYVGEELDLVDLIDEVYDTTGQLADKKEVEIIGTVDNSKPGETVIVYKYNNIEKKATIVVKENKTSVKVHDSIIYVGDTWEAKDNFDSAIDKDGQSVAFEKITVGGETVDTTKAGRYEVLYSYEGTESKAVVTVKEKQASVKVHDSIIYVGDTWEAKDNFDGATDKDGQAVAFEKITVGGETVDTTKAGRYEVLYSYEDIESKAVVTVKE
ncbi:TPA: bacterial Ig-like domain-containing protein, partial [Enterococcus faecalis]|nr:bacterial Ig-like domain-containing protein [Enterococcus faecalis]